MSKTFKRIAVFLVITLVSPMLLYLVPSVNGLTQTEASAAVTAAKLTTAKITTGINSSPEYIGLENVKSDAVYTYKSSDEAVAMVDEGGYIVGKSKGTATITVTETVNGTSTELGQVTVTIGASKLAKDYKIGYQTYDSVPIIYKNKEAKYSFKSSSPKVVKVDKDGFLQGLKFGSSTISVTEKYKGKTTKLGSVKVKVVKTQIADKVIKTALGSEGFASVNLAYYNGEATYKYTSSNKSIVKVNKYGALNGVKVGKTKVNVTEIYKKKTRKVGSVTVEVVNAAIAPDGTNVEIGLNAHNTLIDILNLEYFNWSAEYTCESADSSIISVGNEANDWGSQSFMVKGIKDGQTTLTVYEEYKGQKRTVGTINVTVKEFPITSFKFDTENFTNEAGVLGATYSIGSNYSDEPLTYYLVKEPYNATTPVTFSSSDENVIKVDNNGVVTPVKAGTATITATCGSFTSKLPVTVKSSSNKGE